MCDDNIIRFTYPRGPFLTTKLHLASHQKDIFMKVFLYFVGIGFACVFSVSVSAKTSSGEIMTMCKSTVKESMDGVTRIRTSKFKERASELRLHFVSPRTTTRPEKSRVRMQTGWPLWQIRFASRIQSASRMKGRCR